ncbi:MAG: FecR domain-containing protein [Planctomycetota bacterium]
MNEPNAKHNALSSYAWDGTGEIDPFVAGLERALRPLAIDASRVPPLPTVAQERPVVVGAIRPAPRGSQRLAAAALIVLGVGSLLVAYRGPTPARPRHEPEISGWSVAVEAGAPLMGHTKSAARPGDRLQVGEWLATGPGDRATLKVATIGTVTVRENSQVSVLADKPNERRLRLGVGAISVFVTAPPRLFTVETPLAHAVDLGCVYDLSVEANGQSLLHVMTGSVELLSTDSSSKLVTTVTAGAECHVRDKEGPGVPYFPDASPEFIESAELLAGFGKAAEMKVAGLVPDMLAQARARDGTTLWHLLPRVGGESRRLIAARLNELVPIPGPYTVEEALALDPKALASWWDAIR